MPKPISFRDWLAKQEGRGGDVGDLAFDVARDIGFPKAGNLTIYLDHLTAQNACDGALDALREAWAEWTE